LALRKVDVSVSIQFPGEDAMKALLVSAVSAAIAGGASGGYINLGEDVLQVEPARVAPRTAILAEDPGVTLHRTAMGAETWTAPPPAVPAALAATDVPALDELEAKLSALAAQTRQQGDDARRAYARLFEDVPGETSAAGANDVASPDVAAVSLPR
jgi:hypothetical protein